jgi:hypothetical protein
MPEPPASPRRNSDIDTLIWWYAQPHHAEDRARALAIHALGPNGGCRGCFTERHTGPGLGCVVGYAARIAEQADQLTATG